MSKLLAKVPVFGALMVSALYWAPAWAGCELATKDGSDGCARSNSNSMQSTPSRLFLELHTQEMQRQDAASAAYRSEREARRRAADEKFDAEWRLKMRWKEMRGDISWKVRDELFSKLSSHPDFPSYVSSSHTPPIMLGYGRPATPVSGTQFMRDQNGNQVGVVSFRGVLDDSGRYLDVSINVSNATDCKMSFNGFFKEGEVAYDLLAWDNGAELSPRQEITIKDRIVIGGIDGEDFHRFDTAAVFKDCEVKA